MRGSLTVSLYAFFSWMSARRLILMAVYLAFSYFTFLSPYILFSEQLSSPLGAFELFTVLECQPAAVPFIPLLALLWFADVPMTDGSVRFVLHRTGRARWLLGQMVFMLLITLLFQLCLLVFCFLVCPDTFLADGWSLVLRRAALGESDISPALALDNSVLYQSRPYAMVIDSMVLTSLYMLFTGLLQLVFGLLSKRVIGLISNLLLVGAGFALDFLGSRLKWLLPLSHSVFTGHSDAVLNIVYCPIWASRLYFGVLLVLLGALSLRLCKRSSFQLSDGAE